MVKDFNIWNKHWKNSGEKAQKPNKQIIAALEKYVILKNQKILELGAGSGLTSIELNQKKAFTVTLDLSEGSIGLIRKNSSKTNLKIIQADIFYLPFKDKSFGVVFHQGLIEHFRNPQKILSEQMRVLKKHGIFLIDVPQKFSTYTLMKHRHIKQGNWYAGWESEYSVFALKKIIRKIKGYKLKIISSFGYGTWGILTRIRYLHYRGNMRFGHPILPKPLFNLYEALWQRIENSFLMKFIAVNICVIGVKE